MKRGNVNMFKVNKVVLIMVGVLLGMMFAIKSQASMLSGVKLSTTDQNNVVITNTTRHVQTYNFKITPDKGKSFSIDVPIRSKKSVLLYTKTRGGDGILFNKKPLKAYKLTITRLSKRDRIKEQRTGKYHGVGLWFTKKTIKVGE